MNAKASAIAGIIRLLEKLTGKTVTLVNRRARGVCPECGGDRAVRTDGVMARHPGRSAEWCAGSLQTPFGGETSF